MGYGEEGTFAKVPSSPYPIFFKTFIGVLVLQHSLQNFYWRVFIFGIFFVFFFNLVQMRVEMGAEVRKLMQGVLSRNCPTCERVLARFTSGNKVLW